MMSDDIQIKKKLVILIFFSFTHSDMNLKRFWCPQVILAKLLSQKVYSLVIFLSLACFSRLRITIRGFTWLCWMIDISEEPTDSIWRGKKRQQGTLQHNTLSSAYTQIRLFSNLICSKSNMLALWNKCLQIASISWIQSTSTAHCSSKNNWFGKSSYRMS